MVALSFSLNIVREIGEECYRSGRKSVHLNEKFINNTGPKTHIPIFIYICTLMTIEKINDMRSRVAGIRRFL